MFTQSCRYRFVSCVVVAAILGLGLGVPASARAASAAIDISPVYDVPFVAGITIDGDGADWRDEGFRVEIMPDKDGRTLPRASLEPSFRLAWDERGLLVLLKVRDDFFIETSDETSLWEKDSVEVFVAAERGGKDWYSLVMSPGMTAEFPQMRVTPIDLRKKEPREPLSYEAARTKSEDGYVLELLLSWANLGIGPGRDRELAFQVYVNDVDGAQGRFQAVWFPSIRTRYDSATMCRLRLGDKPSPPDCVRVRGEYDDAMRARVSVLSLGGFAGKSVIVREGRRKLAAGVLTQTGDYSRAELVFPAPVGTASGKPWRVRVANRFASSLSMPNADLTRAQRVMLLGVGAKPPVFKGETFPVCDFCDPLIAERLIGTYRIEPTFYDREFNPVTSAVEPGRYGAVLEIRPEAGPSLRRYVTLFRAPDSFDTVVSWRYLEPRLSARMPDEARLDPDVVKAQSQSLGTYLRFSILDDLAKGQDAAVLFAGMYDASLSNSAGQTVEIATAADDVWAMDRQWWVQLKRKLNGMDKAFPNAFSCPRQKEGKPAPELREGTALEAGMKADAVDKLDAVCRAWVEESHEPFAVCLARHGVVFFHNAYGTRYGEPMTVDTKSWMASISKFLSGALMMTLVDQGLVDLDEPIDKYLPALRGIPVKYPLTIRNLYTHTSGLGLGVQLPRAAPDHWGDERNDLEEIVAGYYPCLEVGAGHAYNGTGYALGGKIIESMTGEALPQFFKRHLWAPLGCEHTDAIDGSAWTMSVPLDIAKFGQMLLNRGAYGTLRFFSEETFEKMLPVKLAPYVHFETEIEWGIGPVWTPEPGLSKRTFGHGAASGATLRIDPENDLVIVMTRNASGSQYAKYHPQFIQAIVESMAE